MMHHAVNSFDSHFYFITICLACTRSILLYAFNYVRTHIFRYGCRDHRLAHMSVKQLLFEGIRGLRNDKEVFGQQLC